ncbi:hypothetical protein [Rhodovibrio salinarum]|uniref:Uncharacterized protein n=1 Tax=Rhodovibrio salinarum TaxID=1087 RepID=A0A934QFX9_9PROT|nr:hypothetical protein [Rhodovibrio salinarum]MBK1696271.1 hypothetical protein [Rhodovibrio salinarum]
MTVASLNARLLARKGDARPAPIDSDEDRVRPPVCRMSVGVTESLLHNASLPHEPGTENPHARVRVSLRLTGERHRRLRLASIHLNASLQQILTHALDQYLAQLTPACPCMGEAGAGSGTDDCLAATSQAGARA